MKRLTRMLTALSFMAAMTVAAPTAMAHSRVPGWSPTHDVVTALTPSTVVIQHPGGLEQKLALSAIAVRAAMYPSSTAILRPGEDVSLLGESGSSTLMVVHPVAYGQLTKPGNQWQVARHHQTVSLNGSNPEVLGMSQLQAGQRVMVFGVRHGDTSIDTTAVAAPPLTTRSVIKSASADQLTLQSPQYGTLTWSLTGLPSIVRQQVAKLVPGKTVIAGLDPISRQVLMVWPDHMERWAHALERGSAGQIVAVSPKDLTLTNHLGTVTVPLNGPVQIRWQGHTDATLSQLTPGTRVMTLRKKDGHLTVVVLTP